MADSLAADKRRAGDWYGPGDHPLAGLREAAVRRAASGRDSADNAEPGEPRHGAARRALSIGVIIIIAAAWLAALLAGGGVW